MKVQRLPGGSVWERLLVGVDSLLLAVALLRPIRGSTTHARVLYIDCGVHKKGLQIDAVDRWFRGSVHRLDHLAFEANPVSCATAAQELEHIESLELRDEALVGPDHGDTVTLYLSAGGKADSMFSERERAGRIEVPAIRLSELLPAEGEYDTTILRMNIEGAEPFVIDDLVDAGALGRIDAFYGMWDDLSKIDPERDAQFRVRLKQLGIRPVTFNDRDFENPELPPTGHVRLSARIRLWAIRRHMRWVITRSVGQGS